MNVEKRKRVQNLLVLLDGKELGAVEEYILQMMEKRTAAVEAVLKSIREEFDY